MSNAFNLNISPQRQLLNSNTSPRLEHISTTFSIHSTNPLTGYGFSKNCLYPSFIASKSFIDVMKILTLTTFFNELPPASSTADTFVKTCFCNVSLSAVV